MITSTRIKIREEYDSCEKQRCSCSKPQVPYFKDGKGGCTNKMCKEFSRIDFGCWQFAIGKKPVKLCLDECECICHTKVGEMNAKK